MFVLALIFLTIFAGSTNSFAAGKDRLSPGLEIVLRKCSADDYTTAVVFLKQQFEIEALDQELHGRKATRADRHRIVVENLQAFAERNQVQFREYLNQATTDGRVSGYRFYWITNAAVVRGQASFFYELSQHEDVEYVDENLEPKLIEPVFSSGPRERSSLDLNHGVPRGIKAINVHRVWYELGITGAGRLVGNFDTGVDGNHPALSARWRGAVAPHNQCWLDLTGTTPTPYDGHGHGTHTLGTICGNSTVSNDSIGVAPNALWIACRGVDQSASSEFDNDALAAFQWFTDPDGNPLTIEDVPDAMSNSWGVSPSVGPYTWCFTFWNNAIVNCEAAGVVVLFSAGNSGSSGLGSPATVAIDSVTNFAVGAIDATNDTIPPYNIASFSSIGPSHCPPGSEIKPEVSAPGVDVYSCTPGSNYQYMSGTSMACPHVAGVIALMREASPDAEVREIKSVLIRTAIDQGTLGNDNTFGFGVVDAYAAVQMLRAGRGFVSGLITAQSTGNPIPGAVVRVVESNHWVRVNSQGRYFLSLLADSLWHLRFEAFGYTPLIQPVTVTSADTTLLNMPLPTAQNGTLSILAVSGADAPIEYAQITLPGTPISVLYTDSTGRLSLNVPGDTVYAIHIAYHDVTLDTFTTISVGQTVSLTLRLHSPRVAMCGPDAYGYRSFDRYDSVWATPFEWVEIAPSLGGAGIPLSLPARDSSAWIEMPFPFRYYGQAFDSLTINENGWLTPGVSHDHVFFNYPLPGTMRPIGTIAPLWDNLFFVPGAELCFWYDSLHGKAVIEYRNVAFASTGLLLANFQVQILSTESYPTPTGDCEIVFLYRRVDLPGYCTVGIENPLQNIGLQVLYNGSYNPATWQIGAGSAIRFTTRPRPEYGSLTGQIIAHPPLPDLSGAQVRIGGRVLYPAVNGDFTADSLLTGTYRPRLELAGYERDTAEVVISHISPGSIIFEVWRLDSPRELSAIVFGHTVELRWSAPEDTSSHLDALREYHVWRDGAIIASTMDTTYADQSVPEGSYQYHVTAVYDGGESLPSDVVTADVPAGAIKSDGDLPAEFALESCYPNPFNPTAIVRFSVPHSAYVRINVYDILGRQVLDLVNGTFAPGQHSVLWNCSSCSSGLYWIVMQSGDFHALRKAALIR